MLEADYRHHRLGLGRLGARLPPVGGRQAFGHRHRIWRHGFRPADPDAVSAVDPAQHEPLRLGLFQRAGAASRRPRAGHAARQGARRLFLDQRHGLCAGHMRAISTTGPSRARPAGASPTCSPISSAWSTPRAARTAGAAPTGRCMSSAARAAIRSTRPSSRPASRRASS